MTDTILTFTFSHGMFLPEKTTKYTFELYQLNNKLYEYRQIYNKFYNVQFIKLNSVFTSLIANELTYLYVDNIEDIEIEIGRIKMLINMLSQIQILQKTHDIKKYFFTKNIVFHIHFRYSMAPI